MCIRDRLSINLSTYLDELFRLTVYLYYDDSVVAALEATGGSDIDRLQRRRVIESYLDKIMIMPRKDILNVFVITDDIYFSGRMPKSVNHSADYQALDWYQAVSYPNLDVYKRQEAGRPASPARLSGGKQPLPSEGENRHPHCAALPGSQDWTGTPDR